MSTATRAEQTRSKAASRFRQAWHGAFQAATLFLGQVTPKTGWRNEGLPAREPSGRQRLANPPLALDLRYLFSAYGGADLHGEILLGYAMQLLFAIADAPVGSHLTRLRIDGIGRPISNRAADPPVSPNRRIIIR